MSKDIKILPKNIINNWIVYILKCNDDTYYTGITNNLENRLAAHSNGTGAKYTKGRGPFSVVHAEAFTTRQEASRREAFIKKLSRARKESLFGHDTRIPK